MKLPETWNDEEIIDADIRLWLQGQKNDDVIHAFRIGWKAGARQATINMGNWIHEVVFGHKEPERKVEADE